MKPENMTILTVDDTPANIRLLTHYLQKQGYQVLTAEDGFEGFKAAIQHHPDLILLDVMMPGTDGYEVCELLKAEEETKDIPVVFLTAKAEVEDKIKGFEMGAVDYIVKPFNLIEISTRVETQLKIKYLEKQNNRFKNILKQEQMQSSLGTLGSSIFEYVQNQLKHLNESLHEMQNLKGLNGKIQQVLTVKMEMISRIMALFQKWIHFSQIFQTDPHEIDISAVIEDAVDLVKFQQGDLVSIDFDKPEKDYYFLGNSGKVQQAIVNLLFFISEAFEEPASLQVKVCQSGLPQSLEKGLSSKPANSYLRIDIICDKAWAGGESVNREMDFFLSTSEKEEVGLGLSTAECIVRAHQGVIDIRNEKEKGMTVSLYFPEG